jgi:hypothetical protein
MDWHRHHQADLNAYQCSYPHPQTINIILDSGEANTHFPMSKVSKVLDIFAFKVSF